MFNFNKTLFGTSTPLPSLPGPLSENRAAPTKHHGKVPTPESAQSKKILNVLSALSKADVQAELGEAGVAKQLKKIERLSTEIIGTTNKAVSGGEQEVRGHTRKLHNLIDKAYEISLAPPAEESDDIEETLLPPKTLETHLKQGSKYIPSFFSTSRSQNRQLHQIQEKTKNDRHYISSPPDIVKDSNKLLKDMRHFRKTLETVLRDKTLSSENRQEIQALLKELETLENEIHVSIQKVQGQTIRSLQEQLVQASLLDLKAQARLEAGEQLKEVIRFALAPNSPLHGSLTKLVGPGFSENREFQAILKMNFLTAEPHEIRYALEVVDDVIRERALKGKRGVSLEYAQIHAKEYPQLAAIGAQLRLAHEKYEATLDTEAQPLALAVRTLQVGFQSSVASRAVDLDDYLNQTIGALENKPQKSAVETKLIAELKALPRGHNATSYDELFPCYRSAIDCLLAAGKAEHQLAFATQLIVNGLEERFVGIAQEPCGNFGDDLKTYGRVIAYHPSLHSTEKEQLFEAFAKLDYLDCAPVISHGKKIPLAEISFAEDEAHHANIATLLEAIENGEKIEVQKALEQLNAAIEQKHRNYNGIKWDAKHYGPKPDYRAKLAKLRPVSAFRRK